MNDKEKRFLFASLEQHDPEDAVPVRSVPDRPKVTTGKPTRIPKAAQRAKLAYTGSANTMQGQGGNFYSPTLSTDFLELPQAVDEQRALYRFFFHNEPFVSQAIRLHGELPLSKLRLGMPRARDRKMAERSLRFCEKWARSIGLLHRLIEIVHDYFLIGEVNIFAEDSSPDMPKEVTHTALRELTPEGELVEGWEERPDATERAEKWLRKNYKGWTDLQVLPPEQIHSQSFPFTKEKIIELIPGEKDKAIVASADAGDPQAIRIVESMPADVVRALRESGNIPLGTDPEAGSFVHCLANKKSQYDDRGHSLLEPCMRTLIYRDKLRQAQTSIASRHMTPMRLVWVENGDSVAMNEIRLQIDMALADPDYSIITNFQVNWEEMSSSQRLLDLNSEYELTDRQLYAGLGVTEGLLSGESTYSGDRIHLEVINTRYMLLRELLTYYVEDYLFKPMCAKMGFIEEDEDGDIHVVFPPLTFTRLALRDNSDTFDALFNLYTKGSLDIDVILDLLNIDPVTTREKLERDQFSVNDAVYNEMMRAIYTDIGQKIAENTNLVEIIAERLKLKYTPPNDGTGQRF